MNSKISFIALFLSLFTSFVFPKNDIKIITSDRNALVIEYAPSYTDTSKKSYDNQQYINIELLRGIIPDSTTKGSPAIPQRYVNIGVPGEYGNTIQVLSTQYRQLNGKLIPVPDYGNSEKLYQPGPQYYGHKESVDLVNFGDYGLVRDLPVQTVVISPVQYDASSGTIKLYTRIVFRINFSQQQQVTQFYADEMAESAILNYNVAKVWGKARSRGLNKVNAVNSVLSEGKWYRFEAPAEGIYRINRSMLASYGIDASTVDPRKIKIYNNGGKIIPENVNQARARDLEEVAIKVVGEEDGKFDEGDYILFYGRGTNYWDIDTVQNTIRRFFNYYSDQNYYWITTSGAGNGRRMGDKSSLNQAAANIQSTSAAYADKEEDKINIGQSGRNFLGDMFSPSKTTIIYTNTLNGRVESTPINYKVVFVNSTIEGTTALQVSEGNVQVSSRQFMGYYNQYYPNEAHASGYEYTLTGSYSGALQGNQSSLKLAFTPAGSSSKGYLDYFEISYEKKLEAVNDYLMFFSKNAGVNEYQLSGFSNTNISVYDVTRYNNVKTVTNPVMLSGGEYRFQAEEPYANSSKYIAVGNDKFLTPSNPQEVPNSNLHGIADGYRYVIITHKEFKEAAERLKTYRSSEAKVKYSSIVVDVDQVYNEFGGGLKDPSSVRDFLKYAFDNWAVRPEYILFFGDGNYDYKNIEKANNNFVPVWETPEYLFHISSYTTDDFFTKVSGSDNKIDMISGRITTRSASEANSFVDKIISYENSPDYGSWRSLVTLVSDDSKAGENSPPEYATHTIPNETLSLEQFPQSYSFNKVYAALYPVVVTSAGNRNPQATQAIIKSINDGTILMSYFGHGNPNVWAHEYIFERNYTISQLHNDNYFFLTTATCDFGYFDITAERSSAEELLLLKNAGSIGVLTAVRPVFAYQNERFIYTLFDHYFAHKDTMNLYYPISHALYLTKQTLTEVNDQKYILLGDPLLRLNFPQYDASIDSINGQGLNETSGVASTAGVQIKALSNTKIEGHILGADGNPWNDFNGQGILTVFDAKRKVAIPALQTDFQMNVQGGVIFRGQVSIDNGNFSTDFIVPKDISYDTSNGKAVMYFYGNGQDGIGYTSNIFINGTDSNAVNDGKGPEIEIYFDDTSFRDTYLVNPDSKLIVKLKDQTGLNTTGTGIGHKLEGILNDRNNDPIDFTNFFTGDLNSGGKSGRINYTFNNIETGEYKLQVKAWDVFNNFSNETVYFSVVSGDNLVIRDIYNYPNPFTSNTTFTFQKNISLPVDVKIKVYTIAGRLIREIERNNVANENFVKIDWDGRDQDGNQVANGTYLYKIIVKTVDGSFNNSALGKLAVIR